MLVKAEQWIAETFVEGSQPDIRRVKRWIDKGVIVGTIIDSRAYIDADEFNYSNNVSSVKPKINPKIKLNNN